MFANDINEVISSELCLSCGACIFKDNKIIGRMIYDKSKGIKIPVLLENERRKGSKLNIDFCPAVGIEYNKLSMIKYGRYLDENLMIGHYKSAIACQVIDDRVTKKASSGGIMTYLGMMLLKKKCIDGVITNRFIFDKRGPRSEAFIAKNDSEILEGQGSKYCPTHNLELIDECLKSGEKYLFIGTPCQIAALEKISLVNEKVKKVFPITLTNFCGGWRDYRYLDGMLEYSGISPKDTVSFRFRGGGWPGEMKAVNSKGKTVTQDYGDYYSNSLVVKNRRCTLCIDGTGVLADFSCGDAWLSRFPKGDKGWSIMLARTDKAKSLLDEIIASGNILYDEISEDEILLSQKSNLKSKISRQKSRMQAYKLLRRKIPKYDIDLPESITTLKEELKVVFLKSKLVLLKSKLVLYVKIRLQNTWLGNKLLIIKNSIEKIVRNNTSK